MPTCSWNKYQVHKLSIHLIDRASYKTRAQKTDTNTVWNLLILGKQHLEKVNIQNLIKKNLYFHYSHILQLKLTWHPEHTSIISHCFHCQGYHLVSLIKSGTHTKNLQITSIQYTVLGIMEDIRMHQEFHLYSMCIRNVVSSKNKYLYS